jgi:hypothetical protein
MLVDGWYFTSTVSPLLAPLNNFIYNMNPANLAQHGIHPRYMHLVNLALLFGLALLLVRWPVSTPALKGNPAGGMRKSLAISCLFAISVLSVMPHQEPRFLLPVSVGLFACIPTIPRRFRRLFWPLWIVIQLSLIGLFGFWHQGGVVPCLRYLARQFPPSDAVIQCTVKSVLSNAVNRRYMENCTWEAGKEPASTQPKFVTRLHFWKVYTPPRFFLRDQIYSSNNSNNHHIELIDETGVKGSVIRSKYFNEAIPTDRFYFDSAKKLWVRDLIIAPAFYTREFDRQIDGSSNNLIKCGNDIHLGLDDIGLLSADSLYLRQHASPNDNQP